MKVVRSTDINIFELIKAVDVLSILLQLNEGILLTQEDVYKRQTLLDEGVEVVVGGSKLPEGLGKIAAVKDLQYSSCLHRGPHWGNCQRMRRSWRG